LDDGSEASGAVADVKRTESEALDNLRGGKVRLTVFDAGGGIDTPCLSTLELVVSGSGARAFLLVPEDDADESE
jgi:hypothetical protein